MIYPEIPPFKEVSNKYIHLLINVFYTISVIFFQFIEKASKCVRWTDRLIICKSWYIFKPKFNGIIHFIKYWLIIFEIVLIENDFVNQIWYHFSGIHRGTYWSRTHSFSREGWWNLCSRTRSECQRYEVVEQKAGLHDDWRSGGNTKLKEHECFSSFPAIIPTERFSQSFGKYQLIFRQCSTTSAKCFRDVLSSFFIIP